MKFKEMNIVCDSMEQRTGVMNHLNNVGYSFMGNSIEDHELVVATYEDGDYQTIMFFDNENQIKYKDFMEKYAMIELQKTIEAAKKQGYTNKTLSNALGKYDGYIARIISKPQSEKLQKFLIKEINELLVPAPIDDAMMISKEEYNDLKEKARSAKVHSEEVVKYSLTLEKELDHKNQVLDKRNDKYNLLEGEFNKLTQDKEGLIRTINELEQQNKRVVDSNFELSDVISELKNDYSTRAGMHITSENKRKKERFWFAGITIALLVLFVISHLV